MSEQAEIAEKVAVYESTIQLPTYPIKGENPNPVFRSQYGVAHIYPYTLLDDVDSKPIEKTYRTLVLDNRYLRVTVIPDLGGRVYSVFDKVSNREVFYKNSMVKFSPLAIRGAFFSGGVEFSFPVAHAPTTTDPVNWELRENEDGSASVCFGGLEHISRLRWMITLTLFPDRCALAQDVQLYNPYTIPGRYHYWTNASLDADDQTEFIYPLRRVRSYEFAGTASWPHARLDLVLDDPGLPGMEGVPMWPANRMPEIMDFRWQKNMLAQVSIFGRDVTWDFFGAWRHSVNHGYAHFADHRDVGGMKLWSWGNAGVGVVNQSALTDDGSLYAETQCGAMETQLDFAFLQPGKTRTWREWWLPLRGMGGLTCASAEAGARIHLQPARVEHELEMTLAVCPARSLGLARVDVVVPGKVLISETDYIAPDQPWRVTRSVEAADLAGDPLHITVSDQDGGLILDYTLDRDPSPVEPVSVDSRASAQSSQDYYQLGLKHENFDNRELAIQAYRKAIDLSHKNGEAHFRLGLMHLRAADFTEAKSRLQSALAEGLVESNYYLGILAVLENRLPAARGFFQSVPSETPSFSAALLQLAALAMRQGEYLAAVGLCQQAYLHAEVPISASLLLGMALARAGQTDDARRELGNVLLADPLNHTALHELILLGEGGYVATLDRMLFDDRQYFIDLACSYLGAGLPGLALKVLQTAQQFWHYPMVSYLAGYVAQMLDQKELAKDYLENAAAADPAYCFPSRLEEVKALQFALLAMPRDAKSRYYLGNFYYAHQRYADGIRLWQEALPGLSEYDVLYRNLGLAAWQREVDHPKAIELFEKALSLNPANQDLYLHLDDLYKAEGLDDKREQLLQKILALVEVREDVRKRSILMRVDLGHYAQALEIMQAEQFVPLEMDQSFHDLYERALMLRAAAAMQSGRVEEAISDYQSALEYPENLGVGKPTTLRQAHIYYHLGLACEKLGRFRQALAAFSSAASEHHPHSSDLYPYVQMALDKLSRYSEIGLVI